MVSEAVDKYLKGHIDAAPRLGAGWIMVHAGCHFTADAEMRMRAGLGQLKRMVEYAERRGARLLGGAGAGGGVTAQRGTARLLAAGQRAGRSRAARRRHPRTGLTRRRSSDATP